MRALIVATTVGAVAIPVISWGRTPLVHAQMAETGGWTPGVLRAKVGEPLHLKLISDDVVHGFAVGQVPMQGVDILPGKVAEATVLFERPGTYTFYCTRWCGLNHWRMRGTIEVTGRTDTLEPSASPPLYVSLGIDLDAPHDALNIPAQRPVASGISSQLPAGTLAAFQSLDYYRSRSPYEAWQDLRRDPAFNGLSDQALWNLTASIWQSNTTKGALADGAQLFAQNCAACHGEQGAGNGVFADDLAAAGETSKGMQGKTQMLMQSPVKFTDAGRLLGASPALLQGKILRGGMGTGMPSWGPILTEDETWNIVAYLYSFQFDYR